MLKLLLPTHADRGTGRVVWPVLAGVTTAIARLTRRPGWWHRSAVAHDRRGDLDAACTAIAHALASPNVSKANLRKAAGLATQLRRDGRWHEAVTLLTPVLDAPVQLYDALLQLSLATGEILQWGGSFDGSANQPTDARFLPLEECGAAGSLRAGVVTALRERALRRLIEHADERVGAHANLGDLLATDGNHEAAIDRYQRAIEGAHQAQGRWAFQRLHRWQHALERTYAAKGEPRVDDPFFSCRATVANPAPPVADGAAPAGLFDATFEFNGLRITGMLAGAADEDLIEIRLDGEVIRRLNVGGDGFFPTFAITVQRETIDRFPTDAELTVTTPSGRALSARGSGTALRLEIPHGSGQLLDELRDGATMNKKGVISATEEGLRERQSAYLELYADLRRFFAEELGKPLMLMYGTLLGYHRDGDLIPGDDDFDAGYISDEHDPIAVKEETKRVIATLVRAGYLVSFNRRGRLFRAQRGDGELPELHIDLRPLWFEDGDVWVHNHASFPATVDHFLPVETGTLRGVEVDVPRDTDHFLRGHYGPGWKVPDPGFVYHASDVDPRIRENLGKALITPPEYRELLAQLEAERSENPDMGRFIAVGAQNLYPLDRFIT
jgi:tetratricopeptide (TPR) repeat protein